MENVLTIKKLRKEFKRFTLKDISFDLPRGYIMGFVGPNGSGKTTTLKLIMNLMRADGGEVKVFGQDYIRRFDLDERKKIKELSRGMRTKYALTLALSHRAELLIMDEPTAGLDPVFRRELLDILQDVMLVCPQSLYQLVS